MIVVVDGFAERAKAQMHVANLVPRIVHVVLIAQYLRELIQGLAVGVLQLRESLGLFVWVSGLCNRILQLTGFCHALGARGVGRGGGFIGLDLRRCRRNFVMLRSSAAATRDRWDTAGAGVGVSLSAGRRDLEVRNG